MSDGAASYRILAAQNRARWLRENYGRDALAQARRDLAAAEARGLRGDDLLLYDWTIAALEGRI
jgi:hypothetical protein